MNRNIKKLEMRKFKMTNYAKAYTEVLELLRYLPIEEYSKIPEEKINRFKENMDKYYEYKIDPNTELSKQNISKEANTILISIFRDYFASDRQKEILNDLLKKNQKKIEDEKREIYNPTTLFKNKVTKVEAVENSVAMVEYKGSIFTRIKNWFKGFFNK